MPSMHNTVLFVSVIVSVLVLSACASKPIEAGVAEPVPVATVAEKVAPPEPVPAPAVVAEQPAPKPVVKKAGKKHAKAVIVSKQEAPVEPVPAPVVQPVAPAVAVPEPTQSTVIVQSPVQQAATPGFLEQYWLWLLGLVAVAAAVAFLSMRKKA